MARSSRPSLWSSLPGHGLLRGRAGHTATLVGKKLFVIGGRNGNEFFNDLWEFSIISKEWALLQKRTPLPARAYHTATLISSNQLWVIGGSDNRNMYGDVHVLNTDSLEWTTPETKGQLAGKLRGTHAAIQHPLQDKGILVFGGYGGVNSQWLQDLAVLHTDTLMWEELHPIGAVPGGRGYHTFTPFGRHVLLFGGKGDRGIVPSDTISVYDSEANMWITPKFRGKTPLSRSNHAAALVKDDLIFIHGGRNGLERLHDICLLQILSPPVAGGVDSFTWREIDRGKPAVRRKGNPVKSQEPGGRAAHTLVTEGSSLYLFGGYGGGGLTYNDIFVLRVADIEGSTSGVTSKTPKKRSGHERRAYTMVEDTEGWRSTKKHRRHSYPATNGVQVDDVHILDSDDDTTEHASTEDPGPANLLVEDNERRRSSTGIRNDRTQGLGEAQAEKTQTLQKISHSMPPWEKDKLELEIASLQQVVSTLKAEVNSLTASIDVKNLLESELRAGKAALQQNIQLLQKQVEEGNEKTLICNREIDKWKLESERNLAQIREKEREKSEALEKLTNSEQKVEDLSRSLEILKTAHSKATFDLDCSRREVQNLVKDLEKQTLEIEQMQHTHDKRITVLHKEAEERKDSMERLLKELGASKDSSRALHETVERLAKHVERDNAKTDTLQQEKEKLSSVNDTLAAENVRLVEARDGAESTAELLKGELRVARGVIERHASEMSRMRENAEHTKEHIASLHSSLQKNEEDLTAALGDHEKLRLTMKEVEEFENGQMRSMQNHIEKLRRVRQFGPRS